MVKEDGSSAVLDEKLDFKVIEFNKESKKIIVSHSRIFEDERKAQKATAQKATKAASKKLSDSMEKTTLGDIAELAALKDEMEGKPATKKDDAETKNESAE